MQRILDDDQQEQRQVAFTRRLGLRETTYRQTAQAAAQFTSTAAAASEPPHWRQWGARNLGGSILALAQHPHNPALIYAGSGHGGVFRSEDAGDTWQALGQLADSFPVGALALAPSNPSLLYMGSGEPSIRHAAGTPGAAPLARQLGAAGPGLFRYDATTGICSNEVGGAAALPAPDGAANSYAAIAVDPRDAERCWLASHTGLWRREPDAPRFRREPIPIAEPLPLAPSLGACVSDVLLVEHWSTQRPTSYRLFAAVAGVGVFRGVFEPETRVTRWEPRLTAGLPEPGSAAALAYDRIRLAGCQSSPGHLYAVFANSTDQTILGVFHSSDGGDHFTACALPENLGAQAAHHLCVAVHPQDPRLVLVGNVRLARSLDAGVSWQTLLDPANFSGVERAEHGGQHGAWFDLGEPRRLWVANAGGICTTADIVEQHPATAEGWRSRSHGLCVASFHYITAHPSYPFILGGGLEDRGTCVTFGGPTWFPIGDAEGGQMCFEPHDPRRFVAPHRGDAASGLSNLISSRIVAGSSMDPVPGFYPRLLRSTLPDLPGVPHDVFAAQLAPPAGPPAGVAGLFVPRVLHHPTDAEQLLASAGGDLAFSTDGGLQYMGAGAATHVGTHDVTALAYGPGATARSSDWWIGTSDGVLVRGDGGDIPKSWVNVTPPLPAPGLRGVPFTSIAVHPSQAHYVVAATGGDGAEGGRSVQGRVFLSNDRGAHWLDITGLGAAVELSASAPAPLGTPLRALPPCPVTSLAFDPTTAGASPQVLYVGTLAGVYVIRNLPPLPPGPPPAILPPAPFNPDWRSFNGLAAAPLPLTQVNDLQLVQLPARPGAAADSPESMPRLRLYAALHGRGIFVCDVSREYPAGVPAGGPARRLFLRQHSIEDGLAYPRPLPAVLNAQPTAPSYNQPQLGGDPRLPALPNPPPAVPALPPGAFTDFSALDIRIDNAPFQLPDVTMDGVTFDLDLRAKDLAPGQLNAVYVQVHDAGWDRATQPVEVHLFFAPGAPPTGSDAVPLPNLHANFWSDFRSEPELPEPSTPLAPGTARWRRAGKMRTIAARRMLPGNPAVVRFDWTPPSSLANGYVALLAVCTSAEDSLGVPPARLLNLASLIREERRVAFRLARALPFTPSIHVRDSVDDTGRLGHGSSAGRSPDIIVAQTALADPAAAFADLSDNHRSDRIVHGVDQNIYVRVHNASDVEVDVDVEVSWVQPNAALTAGDVNAPAFDGSKWQVVAPVGPAAVSVPARGWALARVIWQRTDVPPPSTEAGVFNAVGLAVLISSSSGAGDAAPQRSRVRDAASFWSFFSRMRESNNAAFRVVEYAGAPAAFTFDPPGRVDDLGVPGDAMYDAWSDFISREIDANVALLTGGVANPQFYNPRTTPTTAPSAKLTITWKGFPMSLLREHRDNRQRAWEAAEQFLPDGSRNQDEYLEWFAHKRAGKIVRVDFTAEAWDYWAFLGAQALALPALDRNNSKLVQLYRRYVDPSIRIEDLVDGFGTYDRFNAWNTTNGAMHLTNRPNSLGAEINLVALATRLFQKDGQAVTDPLQLIRVGGFGAETRSSDPRIGWDVNNLARLGFAITLDNPVGLLIDDLDDSGFQKPDGTPAGNYWKVQRGFSGGTLRATYEVPAAEGFVVGDLLVGGRRVEFGGQIAEHVTMKVVGLACRANSFSNTPTVVTEPGPGVFGLAPSLDPVIVASSELPSRRRVDV
jgi:hypothetical protein